MPTPLRWNSRLRWLLLLPCLALSVPRALGQATPAPTGTTQETFGTGSKPTYPAGEVSFPSGTWLLTDAVVGATETDHKNGAQAVRVQQAGRLTMQFYLPDGAAIVTVQHALYGTDASSSWELWAQPQTACNCDKWTKVGRTVFTTSSTQQAAAFTVNIPGAVKFGIRKTSGGPGRLNLGDFAVTPFGTTLPPVDNDHLALGNPSGVTTDPSYPNNYLLSKPQYAVSYSRDRGTPNWVSWHLDSSDRGGIDRQDDFRNDTSLPDGWYQVQSSSYTGSGFDRGHNCPSADRTSSRENNSATFLMTNMIPQAPNNNQKTWANLENYTRTFLPDNEAYIICGSYGVGGTGSNGGTSTTIDQGRVTVPNRVWKVVVILPVGDNDVARITTATRIIAIDTPNTNTLSEQWGDYRTTVDAIEAATGLDLLSSLPLPVQAAVEAKVDNGPTN